MFKKMVTVLPARKQEPLAIDLTGSGHMKQEFLMSSALPNMVPLSHQDSKMATIKGPSSSLTYSCYKCYK